MSREIKPRKLVPKRTLKRDDGDHNRTRRGAPLHFTVPDRRLEGKPGVPGEIDPGVLRYLCDERVDHGSAHGLGVDGREMRLGPRARVHAPSGRTARSIRSNGTLAMPEARSPQTCDEVRNLSHN